jgi:hypothetical protein
MTVDSSLCSGVTGGDGNGFLKGMVHAGFDFDGNEYSRAEEWTTGISGGTYGAVFAGDGAVFSLGDVE